MFMIWFIGYLAVQIFTQDKSYECQLLWRQIYFAVLGVDLIFKFFMERR